ncbi:bidirectional sugar transporter SWEET14-like [Macadamia integrifolia]|uniref:bidirectional sugar transporter SWEET14-like n=1 Tax=Macadamia integrifolia TaxID=60698 RepID=UPI001C50165A|nr:bidirectional sugar transporter SWEET14-like [Macadamia integrifolia]
MGLFSIQPNPLVFTFGLLGNIISFMVYIAPTTTFVRVCKKKSTEGFQSLPYVTALFSAMLWIYYAYLKTGAYYLITINSVGCVIETIYIAIYLVYAPKKARILTAKLLVLMNLCLFSMILILSQFLAKGQNRVRVVGWICDTFSVIVFVAPLSIVRLVIRTRSVEYMPFTLSFFLTLSAVMWFSYGFLLKDLYIALPNILGFIFGVLQMVLYLIYKGCIKKVVGQKVQAEQVIDVAVKLSTIRCLEVNPVEIQAVETKAQEVVVEEALDERNKEHEAERNPTFLIPSEERVGPPNELKLIVCQA